MRVDAHPAMLAHMHFKMLLICKTSIANLALDGEPLLSNPLEYLVSRRSKHDWIRGHGRTHAAETRDSNNYYLRWAFVCSASGVPLRDGTLTISAPDLQSYKSYRK